MINTVSITDLKQNTASVIKRVREEGESVVVIQHSEVAAILVEPEYYQILEKAMEDKMDIQSIEERKNEPRVSFDKVSKKLGLK